MPPPNLPTLRWGVIATGMISSWFVKDLVLDRPDAKAHHTIEAIGSSSQEKGQTFAQEYCPHESTTIYGSYEEVYTDPSVDIVYIGTPHAFHLRNCLDAIAHGKHVLCEKAFTLNASQAREVFAAAKDRGVFVMEAMWIRFHPLTRALQVKIHEDNVIGRVQRVFCDFSLDMDIDSLPDDSRLKNPALGAGSLLDIGIYSLTWALLAADPNVGGKAHVPGILASQKLSNGADVATAAILGYPSGIQAIVTSSLSFATAPQFCRIEGTEGFIIVQGPGTSAPERFTVHLKTPSGDTAAEGITFSFNKPGMGFYWEADAVAVDISEGRIENDIMPWAETIRVLEILDEIRRQGGARYDCD
ncbi:dimeric dihydrodiol dehydrogenase [Penicillium cosmopolitanum]|uniref:D-xylose 1-dehydrogenase (NADP(+), D-xylono-1,5-lactone-forming) n=1 Tax=Penicillium cosmopolitanum TaxID=1131564 RepID=A0A9W9V5G5_9EURO|nr:dimeric dihydrodiol dehydrogenase [Penicillium cosmopolitanum]KAJ5369432.1 dimeric dihydrodiol dehydrogenase [Penicillium cosmopolitanum]